MSINVIPIGAAALEVDVQGRLDKTDYQKFVPQVESRLRSHGKVGLLIHIEDFSGWTPSALWEDLKFDVKHYNDISRVALVGEGNTRKWMATISKPFTGASVEHFPERDIGSAREWVRGAA